MQVRQMKYWHGDGSYGTVTDNSTIECVSFVAYRVSPPSYSNSQSLSPLLLIPPVPVVVEKYLL